METALSKRLNDEKRTLLGQKLVAKYTALKGGMKEFLAAREKYDKWSRGDYSDRNTRLPEDIYSKSNVPLEFVTGVAEFMIARTDEDLFGSEPYFAAIPQGPSDSELSGQLSKHFAYKLNEARFKQVAKQAIARGYHLGEGLIKVTYRKTEDVSEQLAMVLCGRDEKAVVDPDGEYIFPEDHSLTVGDVVLWSKSPIEALGERTLVERPEVAPMAFLADANGEPSLTEDGDLWYGTDVWTVGKLAVLSKSPVTVQGKDMEFREHLIEERSVLFDGLDISLLHHEDVVVPLNVRHLSESRATFHRLSLTLSTLKTQYGLSEKDATKIGSGYNTPQNKDKQPQHKEGQTGMDLYDEDFEYPCIEAYAMLDALGDGKMVRVYALVEIQTQTVIACDYWANVVPECKNPIIANVPCPVPGRWYGRGYQEIYENQTEFLDRNFNAIIYRNKIHANPPTFLKTGAFKDEASAKNFTIAPGKIHLLKNDVLDGKDVISFVAIPDLDSRTWTMLELVMQMAQVRSGVTGAAQGAVTNLPSNGTATGVQSIMLSGSTLHKNPIECCKDGQEEVLALAAMVLYANQDRDETFVYTEGDATELITLNHRNVKDLKLNVRLLLTRLHEREALESAKAAIEAVMEYINGVPEGEKDQLRPLFIQALKALRITGADAILRKALPPDPNAQPPQQERFTESLNYKDVPEDVKRQMESAAGYTPSTLGQTPETAPAEESLPENVMP